MSGKVIVFPDLVFVCSFVCFTAKNFFFVINVHSDLRFFGDEVCLLQAHSREWWWGGGSACSAPTAHLTAPTRNLQNIKNKRADQPAKILQPRTACTCCVC